MTPQQKDEIKRLQTPRTDAAISTHYQDEDGHRHDCVFAEFAQTLEIEVATLTSELERVEGANRNANALIGAQAQENDKINSRLLEQLTLLQSDVKVLREAVNDVIESLEEENLTGFWSETIAMLQKAYSDTYHTTKQALSTNQSTPTGE